MTETIPETPTWTIDHYFCGENVDRALCGYEFKPENPVIDKDAPQDHEMCPVCEKLDELGRLLIGGCVRCGGENCDE